MNPASLFPSNLPAKPFSTLLGREKEIYYLLDLLNEYDDNWIISINGIGGIGKTALALEVANICVKQKTFDAVIWYSFHNEQLPLGAETPEIILDKVIETIAYTLNKHDLLRLDKFQRKQRVLNLMKKDRLLVILDSCDLINNYCHQLVIQLQPFVNPSKVIITSRSQLYDKVYSFPLSGFSTKEAIEFTKLEAQEKALDHVLLEDEIKLARLVEAAGHSPLLLKLVVSQLSYLPLEIVNHQLLNAGDANKDIETFYKHIFFPSWNLLSNDGKELLVALAVFMPGSGGTIEAVKAVCDFDEQRFHQSISELKRLSLVETSEDIVHKHSRFFLHPLTHRFILSEILNAD